MKLERRGSHWELDGQRVKPGDLLWMRAPDGWVKVGVDEVEPTVLIVDYRRWDVEMREWKPGQPRHVSPMPDPELLPDDVDLRWEVTEAEMAPRR